MAAKDTSDVSIRVKMTDTAKLQKDARKSSSAIKGTGTEAERAGRKGRTSGKDWDRYGRSANQATKETSLFSDALEQVGGLVAAGGLAGALTAAFNGAIDLEAGRSKLKAQLGLSADDSARAGKVAGALYKANYGESMDDVNGAIASVGQNITSLSKLSDREMSSATGNVLNLAKTFGTESGEITRAVGGLIRNGMAKNTTQAFDLLTRGFQGGADKGGEFLDTLNEYAEPMKSLGFDAKSFTNILVQGSNAGIYSVDKIGDAFKEFSIRAVDGSQTTKDAYHSMGLDATDYADQIAKGGPSAQRATTKILAALRGVKDPVKRETAGVALFGSMWEDIGGKAILGLNPATNALGKTRGAAKRLGDEIGGTTASKFESFKRTVTTALSASGTAILGIGKPLYYIAGAIAIAFAVQGLIAFTTALKGLWLVTKLYNAAQIVMIALLYANPLVLIGVAVVALAAGFVILYRRSETFRNIISGVWGVLRNSPIGLVIRLVGRLVKAVWDARGKIASSFGGIWNGLKTGLVAVLNWVIGKLNSMIDKFNKINPFGDVGKIGLVGDDAPAARGTGGAPNAGSAHGAPPVRRATGGFIPGKGRRDTTPVLATPGEFMVKKAAAQRIGPQRLNQINNGVDKPSATETPVFELHLDGKQIEYAMRVRQQNRKNRR